MTLRTLIVASGLAALPMTATAQDLLVSGTCPGVVTMDVADLTPGGNFALVTGVLVHLGIGLTLGVGTFTWIMLWCYLAWLPEPWWARVPTWRWAVARLSPPV